MRKPLPVQTAMAVAIPLLLLAACSRAPDAAKPDADPVATALRDADGMACVIYSDSEFWINVVTKWAPGWQARGWTKKGGEIKNLDIVQELYELFVASQANLCWVRGHEGDEGNELADEWANRARAGERL